MKKLNNTGFTHLLVIAVLIVMSAVVGTFFVVKSKAATSCRNTVLRQGSKGTCVRYLQEDLNRSGSQPQVGVDGAFGSKTKASVIYMQRSFGIKQDGIAGRDFSSRMCAGGNTTNYCGAPTGGAAPTASKPAPAPAPTEPYKTIKVNIAPFRCWDVPYGDYRAGAKVHIWDCTGGDNQKWVFRGDGTIRPLRNPGLCIDIPNGTTASGTELQLWHCNGTSTAQHFKARYNSSTRLASFMSSFNGCNCQIDAASGLGRNGDRLIWYKTSENNAQKFQVSPNLDGIAKL